MEAIQHSDNFAPPTRAMPPGVRDVLAFAPDRDAVDENGYPVYLDDSDGEPLETNWHVDAFLALIEGIFSHRAGRTDFYCAGNMFIYFNAQQARNKDYRGPDFFLVNDVPLNPIRDYWVVWKENGRFPNLVVELMSKSTRDTDLTTKFDIYEKTFTDTREYVAYDPMTDELFAWRKVKGKFRPLDADEHGRIYLEEAGLSIGRWQGFYHGHDQLWLRFFHKNGGVVLFNHEWQAARANSEVLRANSEARRANSEALRANSEALRANSEAQRANVEAERAEAALARANAEAHLAAAEKARADALADEVARLKAQLANPS